MVGWGKGTGGHWQLSEHLLRMHEGVGEEGGLRFTDCLREDFPTCRYGRNPPLSLVEELGIAVYKQVEEFQPPPLHLLVFHLAAFPHQ